ncbi:MAG: hypothetical protein H0W88_11280 [Parachlamydiaceae bacterium]|nr:hypothetical protein [Parachlamydiaceae bacterium]
MWRIFFFSIFFHSISLCGEDITNLSFQNLKESNFDVGALNEKKVQIRGFLYNAENGSLIFASQPNLKSCCVGVDAKESEQIVVYGSIKPSSHAVLLEGVFVIDSKKNGIGELRNFYTLNQASLVVKDASIPLWAWIGGAILIITVLYFKMRIFK